MTNTTTGLYQSSADALHAIHLLEESGVQSSDISLVASNDLSDGARKRVFSDQPHSKAPDFTTSIL